MYESVGLDSILTAGRSEKLFSLVGIQHLFGHQKRLNRNVFHFHDVADKLSKNSGRERAKSNLSLNFCSNLLVEI